MIELEQHIEWLLQDNDCVIVPGLGGFITHYTPAQNEGNRFLPPMRIIGFNPLLKLNDGLLVQSYMTMYNLSFQEASQKLSTAVNKLLFQLHETGKAPIGNIGELHLSIHGTYSFIPFDHKLSTPMLYGLASFEMCKLKELTRPVAPKIIPLNSTTPHSKKYSFKFKTSYLSNAVAMIAVIALFFFLPTPIENTEIAEDNYAQLLPNDIFEKLEKQSLAITPIIIKKSTPSSPNHSLQAGKVSTSQNKKNKTIPVAVKEIKVAKAEPKVIQKKDVRNEQAPSVSSSIVSTKPVQSNKQYHIIVASVGTEKDAKAMAEQLVEQGHVNAKAIIGNGKMRVCIESYATESEAYQYVNNLRKNEAYQNAWVLKQ